MCWFFHKWTKWETYTEYYNMTMRWGKLAGNTYPGSDLRQKRSCIKCGKTEDTLIR